MSEYVRDLRARIGTTVLEIPTVSVIVRDARDRVLLVRHVEGNVWTTPGGMIEPYELPADTALREMWEETGLVVALDRIVGVFGGPPCSGTYANGDKVSFVSTVFTAHVIGGTMRPDGEETLELRYFAREELEGAPVRPHVRLYLDAAWGPESAPRFQPPTWRPPET
ncbi:MAG: NUDIX domain-containing protein [Burkholderiales bacterium]